MKDTFTEAHDLEKFKPGDNTPEEKDLAKLREREFTLEDILSVVTGLNLPTKKVNAFYEVLGFFTGAPVQSVSLHMLLRPVRDLILEQHPELKAVKFPWFHNLDKTKKEQDRDLMMWVREQEDIFGSTIVISAAKIPLELTTEEVVEHMRRLSPGIKIFGVAS